MPTNSDNGYEILIQTITAASQLPFVKVDRDEFLTNEFKNDKYLKIILEKGPQAVYSPKALKKRAYRIVDKTTKSTSTVSFLSGLPSNPLTSTIAAGADISQFFGFALNLSQQIAYLFGEENLFSENDKELPEEIKIRIIAYLGVMFGATGSTKLIAKVSETVGKNVGKKVAQQALTKTAWYPLVKRVGSVLGAKITKKTVESVISKSIPIIGGVISGGITYVTFKPMGERLTNTFVAYLNGEFDKEETEFELNEEFAQEIENKPIIDAEFIENN